MADAHVISRRQTRVGAYAICVNEARILLSRIAPGATVASDGMWTLPGGGVEFGEHPRDAVIRELREETGLIGDARELAEVDSWSGHFTHPDDGPTDFHAIRVLYWVRIVDGQLRDEVGGSTDACAWFSAEQLEGTPLTVLARLGARMGGILAPERG